MEICPHHIPNTAEISTDIVVGTDHFISSDFKVCVFLILDLGMCLLNYIYLYLYR